MDALLHQARLAAFLDAEEPAAAGAEVDRDLQPLIDRTAAVYAQAVSSRTREDYVRRWRHFQVWCSARQSQALPADPGLVMFFLMERVRGEQALSLSTLRGWVAAINRIHLEAGYPPPGDDPAMTMFLRGLRRSIEPRAPEEPIKALRIADLREICRALDRSTVDPVMVRDKAILVLHGSGLSARQLARLRWEDVRLAESRLQLRLNRDMGPRSLHLASAKVPSGSVPPAKAMSDWQAIAGSASGHCFIRIDAQGRSQQKGLRPSEITRIVTTRLASLRDGRRIYPGRAAALLDGAPSIDLRDRAILLVGFAGAFRRSELTALRWGDLRTTADGLVLHIRRSKTDVTGRGTYVGIPYGRSTLTCPVRAMAAWQARVEAQRGPAVTPDLPCFVAVGHAGRIGSTALTPEALSRMLRRRAEAAGLPGRWGGRSLRAGFISTAADLDIPLEQIARQSRHATLNTLLAYIRQEDPFRRNAAALLGM